METNIATEDRKTVLGSHSAHTLDMVNYCLAQMFIKTGQIGITVCQGSSRALAFSNTTGSAILNCPGMAKPTVCWGASLVHSSLPMGFSPSAPAGEQAQPERGLCSPGMEPWVWPNGRSPTLPPQVSLPTHPSSSLPPGRPPPRTASASVGPRALMSRREGRLAPPHGC